MEKTFNSVDEMLKASGVDDGFRKDIQEEINKKQIAQSLFSLRCKENLTQAQMAEKLKCSQSRISKIENSYDKDLCVGDLLDYAAALNLNVEIGIVPQMKLVDKIKYHAFAIKHYAEELAHLAKEDKTMVEGVSRFFYDAVFNLVNIVAGAAKKLHEPKALQSGLSVSTSLNRSDNLDTKMTDTNVECVR